MSAQLKGIYSNTYFTDLNQNMVFKKLGLKLKYKDGQFVFLSSINDTIIFACDKRFYFETFNKKYLIISEGNSPIGSSALPYFFPRKTSYVIPLKSLEKSVKIYQVNFGGEQILEDLKTDVTLNVPYYRMKKIDVTENMLVIYDKKNGVKKTFSLVGVNNFQCK